MMGIRDPEEHARRRRPWNRGLSQAAIKEYEQPLVVRVQLLIRRLEEQKGEVDIAKWIGMFSYVLCLQIVRCCLLTWLRSTDFMCDMA